MKVKQTKELEWATVAARDAVCRTPGMDYEKAKALSIGDLCKRLKLKYSDSSKPVGKAAHAAALISWATTRNEVVQAPSWVSLKFRQDKKLVAKQEDELLQNSAMLSAIQYTRVAHKSKFEFANSDAFLGTREWKQIRMNALVKYGPRCMCCGASAKTGAVINVDHIKPRKLFPHLALDIENLQILCASCNIGKGNRHETDFREAA